RHRDRRPTRLPKRRETLRQRIDLIIVRVMLEVPKLAKQIAHPLVPLILREREVDIPRLDLRRHRPSRRLLCHNRLHRLEPTNLLTKRVDDRRTIRRLLDEPLMHEVPVRRQVRLIPEAPRAHLVEGLRERPAAPMLSDEEAVPALPTPPLPDDEVPLLGALERRVPRVD